MHRLGVLMVTILALLAAAQTPALAAHPAGLQVVVGQVKIVPATSQQDESITVRLRLSCSGDQAFGASWLVQVAQKDGDFYDVVLGGLDTPGLGCPRHANVTAIVPTHDLIHPGDGLVAVYNYDQVDCGPDGCAQLGRYNRTDIPVRIHG